ncbi:hypothetical protein MNV49_006971 [Pseudohyphozyma bogoriensis]|nr:hypothetical protein MNV49_006971 [Pseudohyphozyma bogoriensis]
MPSATAFTISHKHPSVLTTPALVSSNRIFATVTGSKLHGTSLSTSDTDIKGIYLPSPSSILLGTTAPLLSGASSATRKPHGVTNGADDVDCGYYSLQRFVTMLGEGQPEAVEMAWAPESAWVEVTEEGRQVLAALREQSERWVTGGSRRFVGFARKQVEMFETKSRRIDAIEWALKVVGEAERKGKERISDVDWEATILTLERQNEHVAFDPAEGDLIVSGKILKSHCLLPTAKDQLEQRLSRYSSRSLAASRKGGVDWKAFAHAVRLANEGLELIEEGRITLPRPEAELLQKIKAGEVPEDEVRTMLEETLAELDEAAKASTRRETADVEWLEEFVVSKHLSIVLDAKGKLG